MRWKALIAMICCALLAGCAGIAGTGAGKAVAGYDRPVNIIDTQYLHQMDRTLVQDQALSEYIQGIRRRLEAAHGEPCDCVVLVDSFSGYEAYTISPKTIVVSSGVIAQAGSEDELAAIIAHELGHVYSWDTFKGMFQDSSVFAVKAAGWALGEGGYTAMLDDTINDISKGLIYSRWNVAQESEADVFALRTLAKAGYSIDGLKMGVRKLAEYGSKALPPPQPDTGCSTLIKQLNDQNLKACSKQLTGANTSIYQDRDTRLKAIQLAAKDLEPAQRRLAQGKAPPRFAPVTYLFDMNTLVSNNRGKLSRALASLERKPIPPSLRGNVAVTNRLAMAHRILGNRAKADGYLRQSFDSPNRTIWTFSEYYRYLNDMGDVAAIRQAINEAHTEVGPTQALLPMEMYLAKRHKIFELNLFALARCTISVVGDVGTYNLCAAFEQKAQSGGKAPW